MRLDPRPFALAALLAAAAARLAYAGGDGAILEDSPGCAEEALQECVDESFSDLQAEEVPLSLDSGIWYPQIGGIFTTMHRRQRASDGSEAAVRTLETDEVRALFQDSPKNTYRMLSADPTARNLFLSLQLLTDEVFENDPQASPLSYLFVTKIVESTLYAAAVEDEREIYKATEEFRNCLQLALIVQDPGRLTSECRPGIVAAAERISGFRAQD